MSNNASQFFIEWLDRLEAQHAQNIEYQHELLREYIMNNVLPTIPHNNYRSYSE